MAGKSPNPDDKGRCSRCPVSKRIPVDEAEPKRRRYLFCTQYQGWCKEVAWNCDAPSYLNNVAK